MMIWRADWVSLMKFGIRNLFNTSTNAYKTKIVAGNHSSERSEITLKDLSDAAASNKFLAVSSIKLDEGKSVNEITNLEEVKSQESLEEVKSQESLAKSNSLDSLKLMSGRRVGIYIPGPESVKVEPIMEDPAISLIAYQVIKKSVLLTLVFRILHTELTKCQKNYKYRK